MKLRNKTKTSMLMRLRPAASAIEYGILLALIATVVIAVISQTGTSVRRMFCDITAAVGASAIGPGVACPNSALPGFSSTFINTYGTAGAPYSVQLPTATMADGSPVTYRLVSSSQPGASVAPASDMFSLSNPTSGVEQIVVNAIAPGGSAQATFYDWVGSPGDAGPYGTVCAIEGGTCNFTGPHQVVLYCPSQPQLASVSQTVNGSFLCEYGGNGRLGPDPAVGCLKVCGVQ